MRIRVVHCEDGSHSLSWVKASDCTHWSMVCPRAKKAKKAKHKLKFGPPGFLVDVNGVTSSNVHRPALAEGEITFEELAQLDPSIFDSVTKRYVGHWCPGPALGHHKCGVKHQAIDLIDTAGLGGMWVPARSGLLITCALGCGFKAAE